MITFELRFDDGEHICYKDTLQEAREYRSEHNFNYISRSIHIYAICKSRVKECKLHHPKTIKLV